ncbi:MAG: DUF4412 domain-containing protein [Gammaproteobacteria bacterium]|nr:DUF4412 domain-containing protein [Gammaproteobacteria bacterium]
MKTLILLAVVLVLGSCTRSPRADIAFVEETETGQPAYPLRMMATPTHLRIDDGKDQANFLVYDRVNRVIQNVNHQEKLVLVINHLPVVVESPIALAHKTVDSPTDAPDFAGGKVRNFQLITNDQVCFDVYVSDVILGELGRALMEYRQTLAGEQAVMLVSMPKDMLNSCDLANNVYEVDRHLAKGFPIRQQEFNGRVRMLVDYKQDEPVDASLFDVPKDYKRFSPQEMRAGTGIN